MVLAWIFLLAVGRAQLSDATEQIPAGDWRWKQLPVLREPARISADFEALSGSQNIRLVLMRREDLDALDTAGRIPDELPEEYLTATPIGHTGQLRDKFQRAGEYVIVLDNRDRTLPATVRLRIWMDFGRVTQLSPEKQRTVVAISFGVFFGIVAYSGRRLWRGVKRNS